MGWDSAIALVFIASGIIHFLFAMSVYTTDKKSPARRRYLVAAGALGSWGLFFGLMTMSKNEEMARMFWRMGFFGCCFFFPGWNGCLSRITNTSRTFKAATNFLFFAAGIIYVLHMIVSPVVFIETPYGYQFLYLSGPLVLAFVAFTCLSVVLMMIMQIRWLGSAQIRRLKRQGVIFSVLTFLVAVPGIYLDFVHPVFFSFPLVPLASVLILFVSIEFFIIMNKDRMMSITVQNISEDIFKLVNHPILVLDPDNTIIHANKAVNNFWKDEITGQNIAGLVTVNGKTPEQSFFRESFFRDDAVTVSTEAGVKNCFMQLSVVRDRFNDVMSKIIIIYDITELLDALNEAKQASIAKSDFLAKMSHEIRTPMNAILGMAEIQLQKENQTQEMEEAMETIYNSGNLLLHIINDILDFSKIEAGKLEISPFEYDVPSLINDTMQLNLMLYESKPIEFILKVDENTPLGLFGDELRIKQVLNNVLSNAFKYTENGNVELSVASDTPTETDCVLVLRVSDTGYGMTGGQVERLFDEYTRFIEDSNRTVTGTGLGMTITKRLLEFMNGGITVESEPGKGSVFTIRIPQGRVGSAVCGADMAEKLREGRFNRKSAVKKTYIMRDYMPYGHVLVVDDVLSNLYVAKGMLLPYGLKIDTAENGAEAVEKVKGGGVYDIIFMDHMMPKMDGLEAVKIIRDAGYTHPIIALTANALTGQSEMFLANGFDDFISKPIDSRELDAALIKFIREKYPPEPIEAQKKEAEAAVSSRETEIDGEMAAVVLQDVNDAAGLLEAMLPKLKTGGEAETKQFIISVHGLKSALANIGSMKLSGAAFELEQAGYNKDMETITAKTPDFIKALHLLAETILRPKTEGGPEVPGDSSGGGPVFLQELNEIIKACEAFDVQTAKKSLAALRQKTWPQNIQDAFDDIYINLLRGKIGEAADAAGKAAKL